MSMNSYIRYLAASSLLLAFAQNVFAVTPGLNWKDSYSVNGQCYCDTTYDHETGGIIVETPAGNRTVRQICETIGPGPGAGSNPIYNDVQCGNGPPNNAIDEVLCPGRVDMGKDGCQIIGPTWNLASFFPDPNASLETETERATELSNQGIPTTPVTVFPATEPVIIEQTPDTTGGSTIQPLGMAVAATDFASSDFRWELVEYGPHTISALDGKYLELLPDVKVTNADIATADNVWPIPGDGPQVHYSLDIEQAGTYAVYMHAYATGEFDDTVHVGFDGQWPESGSDIHTCGTRDQWIWTQCEGASPPTITIPTSGIHSIQIAARDDGFEFDQFVLQLLNDDGSIAVQPLNQLAAQNSIEPTTIIDVSTLHPVEPTAENTIDVSTSDITEPDLGEAVAVGVGSIGFASAPIAYFVLLISALCMLLHRFETTARGEKPKVRSDR